MQLKSGGFSLISVSSLINSVILHWVKKKKSTVELSVKLLIELSVELSV